MTGLRTRLMRNRLRRAVGLAGTDFLSRAVESWEVAPGCETDFPAATMLPGHLERIRGTIFGSREETLLALQGLNGRRAGPTRGFRFRDVDHVDGVLYSGAAEWHLRARKSRGLLLPRPREAVSGALYEGWSGNRWFGNWLMEDCTAWPLAATTGMAVTTAPMPKGHVPRYEELLGMSPRRIGDVHFDELILFDDLHNNRDRMARAAAVRDRLRAGRPDAPFAGVWLMRGQTGDVRVMENEAEIAALLAERFGFRVVWPERYSVDELLDICTGARVVAGVEGSQLVHGLAVMAPGGTLFNVQPPDRVTAAMQVMTDRLGHGFAVLVAEGDARHFRVAPDEVLRLYDRIGGV
jgi:hypothetical protein